MTSKESIEYWNTGRKIPKIKRQRRTLNKSLGCISTITIFLAAKLLELDNYETGNSQAGVILNVKYLSL